MDLNNAEVRMRTTMHCHPPHRLRGVSARTVAPFLIATVVLLSTESGAQRPLTPDQRITHVLNRTGFGIRAGDVARVREMGIAAYLEQQLHPERIPDPVADAKLATYSVLWMSLAEAIHHGRPASAISDRRRDPVARLAIPGGRGNGTRVASDTLDADLVATMRRAVRNTDIPPVRTRQTDTDDLAEIYDARLIRAVYSERQLAEVMVEFWFNHFNIRLNGLDESGIENAYVTHWTERVIRPHALGKFEDLLFATATHPAMMLYLDNWLSAAPDTVIRQRLATWQPPNGAIRELEVRRRAAFFARTKGLNENYARELMELHTLGVNGGYTQKDVREVARAFTGWTLMPVTVAGGGEFYFEPLLHETGDKVVLGRTIKSGGMEEGKEILRALARHPSTARYVSFKLARHFVSDDPPAAIVDAAARTFRETGGDIASVLRTIFQSPEFFAPRHYQAKLKKPLEFVVSALRTANADVEFETSPKRQGNAAQLTGGRATILAQMGQPMGQRETPDGYPDVASAWMNTSALQQRMNFSLALTSGQLAGIRVDPVAAERAFRELGYAAATPPQVAQAQAILAQRASRGTAGAGGRMGPDGMMDMGGAGGAGDGRSGAARAPTQAELLSIATAIYLGSPQFQKR